MSLKKLAIIDGQLFFDQHFLSQQYADQLLAQLLNDLPWQQDEISLYGKTHKIPRLNCYQSEILLSYSYSNISLKPQPYHQKVLQLKAAIEQQTGHKFNAVLINLYRDGLDKMGWHSDDETELGIDPTIASISLGSTRCFKLRHKTKKAADLSLQLGHGSLLLMAGKIQHHWQHSLPQRKKINSPRINLTFRYLNKV